jgi:hypothetical protein
VNPNARNLIAEKKKKKLAEGRSAGSAVARQSPYSQARTSCSFSPAKECMYLKNADALSSGVAIVCMAD